MRRALLFSGLVALLAGNLFLQRAAEAATFDNWVISSSLGFFDNGPALTITPGSNDLAAGFAATVFNPGSQIDGFQNSGCTVGGCISSFYCTLPIDIRLRSPFLNVTAGHDYAIQFNVISSNFTSTADLHVEVPYVQFDYFKIGSSTAISLVPNVTSVFSVDFIPSTSEDVAFGFIIARGRNPNGVASSSETSFTESGSYPFSNFSVTDLSAPITTDVPEPSTWAMLLIGFAGIGFARYRKSRRVTARIKADSPMR